MLNKIAAALIAASMLTAPVLVAGTTAAAAATTESAATAKPGITTVKKHRKHVRHVRHTNAKYGNVVRHGKAMHAKARAGRHHVKHAKKPIRQPAQQGTKSNRAPAA